MVLETIARKSVKVQVFLPAPGVIMKKTPIPFCNATHYRPFTRVWLRDWLQWLSYAWVYDVRDYWLRARYGWAPTDTWSLDHYLATVMAGTLRHLADTTSGAPCGYPDLNATIDDDPTPDFDAWKRDFDAWKRDLTRWADVCDNYINDNYVQLYCDPRRKLGLEPDYEAWNKDEDERNRMFHQVLQEIEPWFDSLWN